MTRPDASSTSQPGDREQRPAAAKGASGDFIAYDQFIDNQLHTARRQVRTIDIAVGLMTLGAGTLAFFLLATLFDHWLLPGGLGTLGRWLALAIYIAGALTYCWQALLPLCIHRINPVYAAHAIERSKPTLKNSLINFLLLRGKPAELAPHVYEAIEQHAATELAQVPVEAAIDRSKLIKIGYAFLCLVTVAVIYKVSSPKDPFQTVGRIVVPWADIAPPTRVKIVDVRPGNTTVMRGQRAKISAEVQGVAPQQAVRLLYSTDDGQIVDHAVPMQVPTDGYLFECELPEGKGGIQQDVSYRVVAGDATSNEFRLTVQAAPTIVVESVDYVYPGYTGMVNQTIDHQGDLKAIEGTQVTLHALANQPIQSATIDFDCNGTDDQRMTFDERHATATVNLALKADRQTPEHASYQLRFTNADGKENPQPIRHQIEVTRDVAPEIQFLAPKQDEIDLPLNGTLVCEVSAHDPDFALARVAIVGQAVAGQPFERPLLEEPSKDGQPWQGQFRKKLTLVPRKLGLKEGDVLEYWAWAEDNKSPLANRTETIHRRARIVSPTKSEDSPDAMANRDQSPDAEPAGDRSPDEKKPGDKPDASDDEKKADDHADPPKAGAAPPPPQKSQPDGDRPPGADPQAEQQPGNADSKQDPAPQDRDRDPAEQTPGKQEPAAGDRSEQDQAGEGQSGQGQSGQEKSGQGQSGNGQTGKGKPGQGQSGKKSAGQEGSDQGESGDASSADGSQGGQRQGGKARGKPGANRSRDEKRQQVAPDGTQDGEAFDEIIDRQTEQEQTDSAKGTRQTATRRSSSPPTRGTPNKQTEEQGSADEHNDNGQAAGEQSNGEKKAAGKTSDGKSPAGKASGDKAPGDKERADKKNAHADDPKKRDAGKEGAEKQPDDGNGTDAEKKPASSGEKKSQHPTKGEKDPTGRPDGKTPAVGDSSGSEEGAAEGKPSAERKPAAGGKQADGKPHPDGKPMNQTGEREEKNPSDDDGQSTPDAKGQPESGQPGAGKPEGGQPTPGKQTADKPGMEKRTADKPGTNQQGADKPGSDKRGGDKPAANQPASDKQPSDDPSEERSAAGQPPAGAKPEKKPTPQKTPGKGSEDQDGTEDRDPNQPAETKSGHGPQPQGKAGQHTNQKPNRNGQPESRSSDGQEDQGESGAGQGGADDQPGSPKPQGNNRPTKKSPGHDDKPDGESEQSGTPPSPSGSDHQSDSDGGQGGDRSGGGKRGGGQKSQQDGPGGPGSHSEADDGGETTPDQDGQETGSGPDGKRTAKEPTGQTGKTANPGKTASRGKTAGSPPPGNQSALPSADGKGSDDPNSDAGAGKNPSGKSGKAGPGPGGGNGGQTGEAEPPSAAAEQADEANLDFARKATELTIQRLRDQLAKGEVDQELLDRLQWSQQDMERWVSRWEAMFRRSAQQGKEGQAARMELDGALRSLGLRPHGTQIAGHRQDDTTHGMKEGRRTRPPAEYRDQVRQYMQGISRTQSGPATGRGGSTPAQAAPAGNGK